MEIVEEQLSNLDLDKIELLGDFNIDILDTNYDISKRFVNLMNAQFGLNQ